MESLTVLFVKETDNPGASVQLNSGDGKPGIDDNLVCVTNFCGHRQDGNAEFKMSKNSQRDLDKQKMSISSQVQIPLGSSFFRSTVACFRSF